MQISPRFVRLCRTSALAGVCGGTIALCGAQPALVMTGMAATDVSPNGLTFVGSLYNAGIEDSMVIKYTRGGGLFNTGGIDEAGVPRMSSDTNSISYTNYNYANLNNATNSITYNPAIPNMWERTSVMHRWSSTGGNVNIGPSPTGNRCDFSINTAYDISGNGRYIVGGGWTGSLCGTFRAMRYDIQTGTWSLLPLTIASPPASTPSRGTRANAVNADGRVVCGYDDNYDSTLSFQRRRAAVWERNAADTSWVTTILDANGGEAYAVSADGTTVIGVDSNSVATRWKKVGATWQSQGWPGFGLPTGVSADGNVVVGDQFIWSPTINGGTPINLTAYLALNGLSFGPGFAIGSPAGAAVVGLSDDGSTIIVRGIDSRNTCLTTFTSGAIYLNGSPCIAPTVTLEPTSDLNAVASTTVHSLGFILNAFVAGTWPLNYQWQKETSPGVWTDLVEDAFCTTTYSGPNFDVKAVTSSQLRIGWLSDAWRGNYRCVVTNSCGSTTTAVTTLCDAQCNPTPTCDSIDFNNDGLFPDTSDIDDFLSVFSGGPCSNEPSCGDVDFNNDGLFPDTLDIDSLLSVFSGGPCL
jgi:hypothetical protein